MSRSIKVREEKAPRNMVVKNMILATKAAVFSDKRNKRGKQDKEWKKESWD